MFDYLNMTPETVYEVRVTIDGIPTPDVSLAPVRWSGGERGLWYIGSSGQVLPNGVYEFTLVINAIAASWLDVPYSLQVIEHMINDYRGGRRGFPASVQAELQALYGDRQAASLGR